MNKKLKVIVIVFLSIAFLGGILFILIKFGIINFQSNSENNNLLIIDHSKDKFGKCIDCGGMIIYSNEPLFMWESDDKRCCEGTYTLVFSEYSDFLD